MKCEYSLTLYDIKFHYKTIGFLFVKAAMRGIFIAAERQITHVVLHALACNYCFTC